MFTVKDVCNLLRDEKKFFINWNGCLLPLDRENCLQMVAYGDFVVNKVVSGYDENTFELDIKVSPVKLEA